MSTETDKKDDRDCCRSSHRKNSASDAVYFFGFIGAAIYYISLASTFWVGVLGFLKAIVWPVFLVLEVLKYLGA